MTTGAFHNDSKLVEYLDIIDQYQKAREQLDSHLAAGFIDLAHANYVAKTRYGKDHYDNRMKSCQKVIIDENKGVKIETVSKDDPIKSFCPLPSASLRKSKQEFSDALLDIVNIVDVIMKLRIKETEIKNAK
ncbi:hypothetical protein CANCADRAFT_2647 [Tortispora caseinolytica NRRL Y-17796]|uniref:Vacuolar ATPase assembly protein VMA22 n=1 Tax=Tortispora caseinolytica NRRL Y-17796 TaxID=767744 RepID=A0A1E4TGQ2_9ASCO|nr:hypothetical protein CANCADRAFT_2647 [Tortispora caseinolytica NRRL Y-17796]